VRVLLDENLPQQLRHYLPGHYVATVSYVGWQGYKNGHLLDVAEGSFDVLITMDQNLPYQQNVGKRNIAVLVVAASNNRLETLVPLVQHLSEVLAGIQPGDYVVVST
jgi:predicted nuclease of predicted toxin-antitoxin system